VPEIRKRIGQTVLRARSAAGLESQTEWLLSTVSKFHGQGKGLADGIIVQVGWSLLRMRSDGNELAVCEPDFDGNPFKDFRDDVTTTLMVLASQNTVLSKVGVERSALRFDEKVVMKKGVLSEARIYAERQDPRPGDSGWYVGPRSKGGAAPGVDELEAKWVFEFGKLRPCLLDVMALPPGYVAIFDGERIEGIADPNDRDLWNRK